MTRPSLPSISACRYRTIVADPPWDVRRLSSPGNAAFGDKVGGIKSIALSYQTMPVDEIAALPIGVMAADDAHLYIWTINTFIEDTYLIARAWGFTPKTGGSGLAGGTRPSPTPSRTSLSKSRPVRISNSSPVVTGSAGTRGAMNP
jgi:hypothetical protein